MAGGSDREPGASQAESQVSEELGCQLSGWGSTLWGWDNVTGGDAVR